MAVRKHITTTSSEIRRDIEDKSAQIHDLMEGYGLSDVRLFGSVAQGRADDKSDVDFLVKDSLSFKGSLLAFSHLIEQLKTLLKRDVDLVFEDQIKPNLKPFIMSQKMLPVC